MSVARQHRAVLTRVALPVLIGMLLLQAAWIFTLPPFRGTDEVDHAYRAAEVAGGELLSHRGTVPDGRGLLVRVPRQVVDAARPVCTSYSYMKRYNCGPEANAGAQEVLVASAAAAYSPLYYLGVGPGARLLSGGGGTAFLYLLRVETAVVCAVLVAAAAWASSLGTRTRWPVAALLVALTPVLLFSASVAAPNGVELCAALTLWCALLALPRPGCRPHLLPLLVVGCLAAVLLVSMRSIGPLWAGLVLVTVAGCSGYRPVHALATGPRRWVVGVATVLVGVATLAAVWWTQHAGVPDFEPRPRLESGPLAETLKQYPLWLLQAVAAFPRRGNPAPALVYLVVLILTVGVAVTGFRVADRRLRLSMVAVLVVALAVPFVLTMSTISSVGPVWQGRYGAPYHVGLVLLAGIALDRAAGRGGTEMSPATGWLLVAGLVLAHALSILAVLHRELHEGPMAGDPRWFHVSAAGAALLVAGAAAAWGGALAGGSERHGSGRAPGVTEAVGLSRQGAQDTTRAR